MKCYGRPQSSWKGYSHIVLAMKVVVNMAVQT